MLKKPSENENGFGVIAIVLVVVVLVAVGVTGYLVYKKNHHTTTLSRATASTTKAPATTSTDQASTQPVDPYAGWKQYCDDSNKACFKYPANWTQTQHTQALSSSTTLVESQVQSPDQGVNAIYSYPYYKDANNFSFLTMNISDIPGYPNLKAVGGIYVNAPGASNYVQYVVVDSYLVAEDGLAVGKTSQFINTARFALNGNFSDSTAGTKDIYQFIAIDAQSANNMNYSLAAAKNWFTTQDAKDSLLMLESLSPEHS